MPHRAHTNQRDELPLVSSSCDRSDRRHRGQGGIGGDCGGDFIGTSQCDSLGDDGALAESD
jgi:hypothetical protein